MSIADQTQPNAIAPNALLKKVHKVTNAKTLRIKKNSFLRLISTGNGKFTTEQTMRMMRGEDWNK